MATPQAILVPIVQSPASFDAVTIAVTMAKQKKGRVYVVHVIEVNRSLPLNAELDAEARRGEQLIKRAEEIAAESGYPVMGTLLQAREAGPAVVEEALDHEVDAIIMGIGLRKPGMSSQLGRTADYVLKNATCAVWVVRQSMIPPTSHHHE
jgi:nucleotide-binding universal stress UspA family protein